jgi:hypothetical protein
VRLWSLHPEYLDPQGLVALWREALLAREVLRGNTAGYRHHPQLERFRAQAAPLSAINAYLATVHAEATRRGYSFDARKLSPVRRPVRLSTTTGQLSYEVEHLGRKLRARSRVHYRRLIGLRSRQRLRANPLFRIVPGAVEEWERGAESSGDRRSGRVASRAAGSPMLSPRGGDR